MYCRRLLQRSALTAWNEASWTILGKPKLAPSVTVQIAPAAVSTLSSRLLTTQRRSNARAPPRSQSRHHPRSANAPPAEQRKRVIKYTPYDPAIHTATTHPPLRILYGSLDPSSSYAIIYKPPNLSTMSLPPNDSVERRLREGWAGVSGRWRVLFPHRLDKHTEGVMVVVFGDGKLNARMGNEIGERRWTKRYRLIGQLPSGVPAKLAEEEAGGVEVEEGREEGGRADKRKKAHDMQLSKIRCNHLTGSLFTSGGPLPSGTLSSHLARRPPPAPAAVVDFEAEEQRWTTDISPTTALTSPSTSTHSNKTRRRIHPFVPETMLYYSVPADSAVESRESTSKYRLVDVDVASGQAMWEAELVTGRSHQLRVHWSDAGCPVVNDPYYNHRYVWQHVQEEKARRARMAAGEDEQKERQEEARAMEQLADGMDKPVILVRKLPEVPQQAQVDEKEEEEGNGDLHSSDADRSIATQTKLSPTTVPRSSSSRLTPLGPSFRIVSPAPSRAFSTQQWQSVLARYGVKSAVEGSSPRVVKRERGVVDDLESMAELREAEEEAIIRRAIDEKRQRKESRKNNKQQQVEELNEDDIRVMEDDEVELYPATATTAKQSNRPTRPTQAVTHTSHTRPSRPPATATATAPASVDHPLASAGWLAMSSPTTRSPFATTSHGMRLQSYYLCIPHPTRPGYELTVVVPLPREWRSEREGEQRWLKAEAEWRERELMVTRSVGMEKHRGHKKLVGRG